MRHIEASKSIMMLTYKNVYISEVVELSTYVYYGTFTQYNVCYLQLLSYKY